MNNQSAIITVTQGDFLYIEEWIQYHKKLGIDLMIIGFNGKPENFEKLPKYDFIRYIDFSIRKDNIIHQEFDRKGRGFSAIELYKPTYSISFMCRCLNILLDYINVKIVKNSVILNKPVAVISKTKLGEDYSVIIPPESTD